MVSFARHAGRGRPPYRPRAGAPGRPRAGDAAHGRRAQGRHHWRAADARHPHEPATQVFEIMWHVNEGLFTYDRNWNPIPHLAESYTLTDGARRYTIALRRGVRFHNGREMTAAD